MPIETLNAVKPALAAIARAPMLELYRTTLEPGQPAELRIMSSSSVTATVTTPAGTKLECKIADQGDNFYNTVFAETMEYGDYFLRVRDAAGGSQPDGSLSALPGRVSQASPPGNVDFLTPADTSSIDGYSCECYYSLLGFYLASKHFPDPAIDTKGDRLLDKVLDRLFKQKDGMHFSGNAERITNGEFMISLLVKRYQATGDIASLEMANEFAEYLLSRQHKGSATTGGYGMAN